MAESVFTREPKVGYKQSCLVAQARVLHGGVSMPVGQRTSRSQSGSQNGSVNRLPILIRYLVTGFGVKRLVIGART